MREAPKLTDRYNPSISRDNRRKNSACDKDSTNSKLKSSESQPTNSKKLKSTTNNLLVATGSKTGIRPKKIPTKIKYHRNKKSKVNAFSAGKDGQNLQDSVADTQNAKKIVTKAARNKKLQTTSDDKENSVIEDNSDDEDNDVHVWYNTKHELKVNFEKSVKIPEYPVFIPPPLIFCLEK